MDFDSRAKILRLDFVDAADEDMYDGTDKLTPLIAAVLREGYVIGQKECAAHR